LNTEADMTPIQGQVFSMADPQVDVAHQVARSRSDIANR
jgi:hypothetical protein